MNKELFLAILKNDIKAIIEILNQKRSEARSEDRDIGNYVNAVYAAEYPLVDEVISEVGHIRPKDALSEKTLARLLQELQKKEIICYARHIPIEMPKPLNENHYNVLANITPLTLATLLGRFEIVKLLIEYGANPNASGCVLGWNTAFAACQYATLTGDMTLLQYLVKKGMKLNQPILDIYYHDYCEGLKRHYLTVLQMAIQDLNIPLIEMLLELGAGRNGLSSMNATPIATLFLCPEAVEIRSLPSGTETDKTSSSVAMNIAPAGDSKRMAEKINLSLSEPQKLNREKIITIYKMLINRGAIIAYEPSLDHFRGYDIQKHHGFNEFSLDLTAFPEIESILTSSLHLYHIAKGEHAGSVSSIEKLLKEGAEFTHKLHTNESIRQVASRQGYTVMRDIFDIMIERRNTARELELGKASQVQIPEHIRHCRDLRDAETLASISSTQDSDVFMAIIDNDVKTLKEMVTRNPKLAHYRYQPYFNLESHIIKAINDIADTEGDEAATQIKNEIIHSFANARTVIALDPDSGILRDGTCKYNAISTINIRPIMLAILLGRCEIIKFLLEYNVVDKQDSCYHPWTPLFFAYLYGTFTKDITQLPFLVKQGWNINDYLMDFDYHTSSRTCVGQNIEHDYGTILHYAVKSFNFRMVKALLACGADINETTLLGWTPLLSLFSSECFERYSDAADHAFYDDCNAGLSLDLVQKNHQMAALLIENDALLGTNGGRSSFYHGPTPPKGDAIYMSRFANKGPQQCIIAIQKLFNFAQDENAASVPESMIENWLSLLNYSFPVRDNSLNTPMHIACSQGNLDALRVFLKILLKHKKPNAPVLAKKNKDQKTPLDCALNAVKNQQQAQAMLMSYVTESPAKLPSYFEEDHSTQKKRAFVQIPIEMLSIRSEVTCDPNDLLFYAIKTSDLDLLKTAIKLKANVNAKNDQNYSPLVALFLPVLRALSPDVKESAESKQSAEMKESSDKRQAMATLLIQQGAAVESITLPKWFATQMNVTQGDMIRPPTLYLEDYLPKLYQQISLIIFSTKRLAIFAQDGNSPFSSATVDLLFAKTQYPFPILDDGTGQTPLHYACGRYGNTRAVKTFMRYFHHRNSTNSMDWVKLTKVPDTYRRQLNGGYDYPVTPFDLAVNHYDQSKKMRFIMMNYFQIFWVNPRVASHLTLLYQLYQSYQKQCLNSRDGLRPVPVEILEQCVKQCCARMVDYLGTISVLSKTPTGQALLQQAFAKAMNSPTLHKIIRAKLNIQNFSSDPSDSIDRDQPSQSLAFMDEDFTMNSAIVRYTNEGLEIGVGEDMGRKLTELEQRLTNKYKLQDAAVGDTKTEREKEKMASSKALTFIRKQIQSKIDFMLPFWDVKLNQLESFVEMQLPKACSDIEKELRK